MKKLHPIVTLVILALLVTTGQRAAADVTAQDCRVRAGLTGNVREPTEAEAEAMFKCVVDEARKDETAIEISMVKIDAWRKEHDRLLIAGGGQLAARSCQEEKDNRRYIENRLIEVGDARKKIDAHSERYESLYRGLMVELNIVYLGTPRGSQVLGLYVSTVNQRLSRRLEDFDRHKESLRVFYVDLQQTRFQDACSRPVAGTPPQTGHAHDCRWQQSRVDLNTTQGRHSHGYVCLCRPENGGSAWQAADSRRCGPYPGQGIGGGMPSASDPSQPVSPPATTSGGWQPVQ